jgi:hypothetical protein
MIRPGIITAIRCAIVSACAGTAYILRPDGGNGWAVVVTTVVCVTGLAAVLAADWINAAPRRTGGSE